MAEILNLHDIERSASPLEAPHPGLAWFEEARYGLFIHWGPYSVAGRGEWVMNREHIPYPEYRAKYAETFRAEKYDPRDWAGLALDAGMKYAVLTAKHHDGFCLWNTATTDYHAAAIGPRRDLVGEYVEAMRAAGLKVGLYFSVADWSHPDYPNPHDITFPREWDKWAGPEQRDRFNAFYLAQLEELMTRYGPIDLLWYDGGVPRPTDGAKVNARVRELQPGILINNRNNDPGDFNTSEQEVRGHDRPWEACMTLTPHAWGHHPGEPIAGPKRVADLLLDAASKGGNLLLNVGPRADGTIPEPAQHALRAVGEWLNRNPGFLPNSGRSPFTWTNWGRYTVQPGKVFAHILYDTGGELTIADIANPVTRVALLDGGRELPFTRDGDRIHILGIPCPIDPVATTLVIDIEGEPEQVRACTRFPHPSESSHP